MVIMIWMNNKFCRHIWKIYRLLNPAVSKNGIF